MLPLAMADGEEDLVIYHPNRQKASSKANKAVVVLLLLATAGLVLIITVGGWRNLQGAQVVSIAYVIIFCVMAYYVARWQRGVLPVASALAVILLVFAAIAAPGWFDRDHTGYNHSGLPPSLIGMLCLILIPVEFLLITFAMRGFTQQWNVEIEMTREEHDHRMRGGGGYGGYSPQPQGPY
jgi:presenilin-like A22 family membrane protease